MHNQNETCWYEIKQIYTLVKKLIMKIQNLKLVILLEHQNMKTFLQNAVPNWPEEAFVIKNSLKKNCAENICY